jgi:hypothetical protein
VFATRDAGRRWTLVHKLRLPAGQPPVWSQLSCTGKQVWQSVQVIDTVIHSPAGQPYLVTHSADRGRSWQPVAARSTDPNLKLPSTPALLDQLAATSIASASSGTAVLIGFPDATWRLQIQTLTKSGSSTLARVPKLPKTIATTPTGPGGYLRIHGASLVGSSGWVFLDDTALGTHRKPLSETVLLHTSDGGSTWTTLDTGTPKRPPSRRIDDSTKPS